ncbi:MAG: DHA2 family efflux MFS transporter permease subunit [Actinobacteria bacterium]|nr:DHA2 family efflux MFS transporter permease subunit [Actinomycetota bacterium]
MNQEQIYARRWWILAILCLSLVVIGLDNTILNVALPTLVRDLDASGSQLQWIVDSYVLVFAGLLLTMGALGDRFGRKLALNLGMVVFLGASIASAFASSADVLIATRAAMGIGGALIMPSTLSILTNVFPPKERGQAIGIWAGVAGLGIVIGPVIGGYLLEHFWWGSVFLINVPVISVALIAGYVFIPESKDPVLARLDPVGALLSIGGLGALVYGIIEAPNHGWTDGATLSAFAIAAVVLTLFVAWELRFDHPMLRMEFFENPRFTAASVSITFVFFAMFGSIFLLTQYLQFVLDYSPLEAGIRVMPVASLVIAAPLSAKVVNKVGSKFTVASGLAVVALSLFILSTISDASGYGTVAIMLIGLGLGMGMTMAPATDSIMGSLPLSKSGVGSAMNDTTRMVGGALGVAVIGSVLSSAYSSSMAGATVGLPPAAASAASDSVGTALAVAGRLPADAGSALAATARSAFVDGMGSAVLVGAGVALAGALVALRFLPSTGREEAALPHDRPEPVEAAEVGV